LNIVTISTQPKKSNTRARLGRMGQTMSNDTWIHPQPMPMPRSPCVIDEHTALQQIARLPREPRIFLWSDSNRSIPEGWEYLASVRQGVPPEGIMAEFDAWSRQYPQAWLAVDLRQGVVPPSTPIPLEQLLRQMPRTVLIIVSEGDVSQPWPPWELII